MTSAPPPISPVERLFAMLHRLLMDIGGRVSWSSLSPQVIALMHRRIQGNKFRIERIINRIRAGTYVFRQRTAKSGARASPGVRQPRPPSLLPAKFGWLLPLIPARPEEYWHANAAREGFETMLNHPEMVALIEAAPVSLGRPLRSYCWMFGLKPPAILAPPRPPHPRPPKPKPAAKPRAPRPAPLPSRPPSRPDAPAWMQNWPPPVRGSRKLA
jgi:hypothetical protein